MSTQKITLPEKMVPLFMEKARYRVCYGGRGSGKTRSFALMTAVRAYKLSRAGKSGIILCARQFMNSLADSSFNEIASAIRSLDWLNNHFDIGEKYIRTKDGRISYTFIGLERNLDSVKSRANIHIAWVDEADSISQEAWQKLLPTVREENSEIWCTFNPSRKASDTWQRFVENKPENAIVVKMNYNDNPFFPQVLDEERKNDEQFRPEQYAHIWLGEFITVVDGAYFARVINLAKEQGRISRVAPDDLMPIRAFFDIGGTGAKADATAIWIAQFIGKEIRVLDHYEAQGQPLSAHVQWMRQKGYDNAMIYLPHDGAANDKVYDVSYQSALQKAGFKYVEVIPNQGKGAASMRVESIRRTFGNVWMNEETTKGGLEALAWYHEKKDEIRGIGLGVDHDWSSHSADAFGLLSIVYEMEVKNLPIRGKDRYNWNDYGNGTSWMSQ